MNAEAACQQVNNAVAAPAVEETPSALPEVTPSPAVVTAPNHVSPASAAERKRFNVSPKVSPRVAGAATPSPKVSPKITTLKPTPKPSTPTTAEARNVTLKRPRPETPTAPVVANKKVKTNNGTPTPSESSQGTDGSKKTPQSKSNSVWNRLYSQANERTARVEKLRQAREEQEQEQLRSSMAKSRVGATTRSVTPRARDPKAKETKSA